MKLVTETVATFNIENCQICNNPDGKFICHNEARTKHLGLYCGYHLVYCENCKDKIHNKLNDILTERKQIVENDEIQILNDSSPKNLLKIRKRYFDLNCNQEFYKWVETNLGVDKAKEYLFIKCDKCENILLPSKYLFEDKNNIKNIWTIVEIENYICSILNKTIDNNEILFVPKMDDYQFHMYYKPTNEFIGKLSKIDGPVINNQYFCSQQCSLN